MIAKYEGGIQLIKGGQECINDPGKLEHIKF